MGSLLGGHHVLKGQCTRGTSRIKWAVCEGDTTYEMGSVLGGHYVLNGSVLGGHHVLNGSVLWGHHALNGQCARGTPRIKWTVY